MQSAGMRETSLKSTLICETPSEWGGGELLHKKSPGQLHCSGLFYLFLAEDGLTDIDFFLLFLLCHRHAYLEQAFLERGLGLGPIHVFR